VFKVRLVHVSRVLVTNGNVVLIGFTVASLNEDAYGTLQQDIPRVLEVLTKELIALEEYDGELVAGVDDGSKDLSEVRNAQALILGPLANGEHVPIYSLIFTQQSFRNNAGFARDHWYIWRPLERIQTTSARCTEIATYCRCNLIR
jgi:hypothetical protein